MLNILYPTDFSSHSKEGLEYAINLTNLIGGRMHIVSVTSDDCSGAEIQMKKLLSGLSMLNTTDNLISTEVIRGRLIPKLKAYVKRHDIDFITMATLGNKDLENIVFGSITKKVATKLSVPLMAIPEDVRSFDKTEKIVLALDNKILEHESTFLLAKHIAGVLGLQIDIIHFVSSHEYDLPVDPFIAEYLGESLGEIIVENSDNFLKGIESYCSKNNVGLIMMVKRPSGCLKNLLHFSNTTQEIANADLPLMILPESE